jgi:hypothetical protein
MKNAPQFAEHFHFLCFLCLGLFCNDFDNKLPRVVHKGTIRYQIKLVSDIFSVKRDAENKRITIIQPKETPQGMYRSFNFFASKKPLMNDAKNKITLVVTGMYLNGSASLKRTKEAISKKAAEIKQNHSA